MTHQVACRRFRPKKPHRTGFCVRPWELAVPNADAVGGVQFLKGGFGTIGQR